VNNGDATLADIATLVKNQMAKIGVEAKINLVDTTSATERVLVKHDFEMNVSTFGTMADINQRSVSFFKGRQSDYMGIDDPKLEDMVHQWRRAIEPEKRQAISADMQRLLAYQLYWVNATGYPFYQAYRNNVKGYPFYNRAYLFLESTWLDK
jgi:peptide/nickel transport system substrate-binding protein